MSDGRRLVDKLRSSRDVLRDAGVGVLKYTEQLTYLLFLNMATSAPHESSSHSRSWRRSTPGSGCWTPKVMSSSSSTPRSSSAFRDESLEDLDNLPSRQSCPGVRRAT